MVIDTKEIAVGVGGNLGNIQSPGAGFDDGPVEQGPAIVPDIRPAGCWVPSIGEAIYHIQPDIGSQCHLEKLVKAEVATLY